MAKNVFSKLREHAQTLRRNTFHLSHTNNLTMPIGKYIPFMCERVMPGDTFKITPYMGLRMMPMVFPIQTSLWCRMHFFYVRNKNLWKNWENQMSDIGQTYEMPYHNFNTLNSDSSFNDMKEFYKNGGLADYLGIPVDWYGEYGLTVVRKSPYPLSSGVAIATSLESDLIAGTLVGRYNVFGEHESTDGIFTEILDSGNTNRLRLLYSTANNPVTLDDRVNSGLFSVVGNSGLLNTTITYRWQVPSDSYQNTLILGLDARGDVVMSNYGSAVYSENYYERSIDMVAENWHVVDSRYSSFEVALMAVSNFVVGTLTKYFTLGYENVDRTFTYQISADDVTNVSDLPVNPYETDDFKLNALPARGYESIYNGFYRKTRNNPLLKNGVPVYNEFITTDADGADSTPYRLFDAYWEDDWLTTATPTPQQGIAPLVGVTGTGLMSFQDSEGNTIYAQARLGDDGNIILGLESYDSKLPDGTLQILQDTIQTGISINDFRNVNALQRWLERNQRIGYRYKDIVKAQFGVDIRWDTLDMPEFIGGVTRQFQVNQISQSVEQEGGLFGSLGSIAGQGGLVGKGERISHYCDDYGYIIGIVSIVPTPVYSQMLPKHFLARGILDYYAPDFGFIGNQPITYKEVAPLQTFMNGYLNPRSGLSELQTASEDVNKVFGYQRAWYDYLQRYDSAHGQFRTSLRDFLMNRTFSEAPELGDEFLHVDESSVNQVFRVEESTDKILGEIFLDVFAKRPIPEYAVPKLEA